MRISLAPEARYLLFAAYSKCRMSKKLFFLALEKATKMYTNQVSIALAILTLKSQVGPIDAYNTIIQPKYALSDVVCTLWLGAKYKPYHEY